MYRRPKWNISTGASSIHCTVYIEIFKYYAEKRHRLIDYKHLVVNYINESRTVVGVYEAERIPGTKAIAINPLHSILEINTSLFEEKNPALLTIMRSDDSLFILRKEEFERLEEMEFQGGN